MADDRDEGNIPLGADILEGFFGAEDEEETEDSESPKIDEDEEEF